MSMTCLRMYCHLTVGEAVVEREHATGEEPEQEPILIPAGIILSSSYFSLNTSASVPCRCERVPHMGRCWRVQQSEATCQEAYACTGLHISPDYINARIIRIPASCHSIRTLLYRVRPFQIPLTASKSLLALIWNHSSELATYILTKQN